MSRRTISGALAVVGIAAVSFGLLSAPGGLAGAAPVTTDNACSNNVQPTPPSVIPMGLEGTPPASAQVGVAFNVTGLKITAQVPAAFIQTGINLGLLKDGQSVSGVLTAKIHATNATPADLTITGTGSGTVHAPGTPPVAQALTVIVGAGNKSWKPTAAGPVTLAQAKTGSQAASPAIITDGSIQVDANIGQLVVKIICKPGTVTGTTVSPAASVTPFATVDAGEAVPTSSTSSTIPTSTSSTVPGSTTTTAPTATTTTTAGPHAPSIELSSTLNLEAGDLLTVTGSGFSPYASLTMLECGPKVLTASNPDRECDIDKATSASTDVSGGFTASMRVLQTGAAPPNDFDPADPAAKCPPPQSGAAASCSIVVRNTEVATETAVKAISFNVPGATTTTTQLQQVVQVPAGGGNAAPGAAAPSGGSPSGTSGGSAAPPSTAPVTQLASTGVKRSSLVLGGLGLLLLDLGYLSLSAAKPRRSPRALTPIPGR